MSPQDNGHGAPASSGVARVADDDNDDTGETPAGLSVRSFWYVVCESHELGAGDVLSRTVLDEDLVVFRDGGGAPVALRDRCMHRAAPLSAGRRTPDGCVQCPYHGWTYDGAGDVVRVPCEVGQFQKGGIQRRALVHETCERDDFVYVRLRDEARPDEDGPAGIEPFAMPNYGAPHFKTVRLQNLFDNNVTNCVENFIDIPHTVFVHPSIFRVSRGQEFGAHVVRRAGEVHVTYSGETDNLGWFRLFLNPGGGEIEHTDHFLMPNISTVTYRFGPRRQFHITSQSVPVSDEQTRVFTDLTFDYGIWNVFAGPIVRWQGQKVIDQDLVILAQQMKVIRKYGADFAHTAADTIHIFVESIRDELHAGRDPRLLDDKSRDLTFTV